MKTLIAGAALLVASAVVPAMADTVISGISEGNVQVPLPARLDYLLIVGDAIKPALSLKPGGCLTGPLSVRENGVVLFSLDAGVSFPADCR